MSVTDLGDIVTGKGKFGLDVKLDGMKFASIEHCPVVGGKVKSFDAKDALKVAGVEKVVEIPAAKPPFGLPSARRSRRHRQQHLGRPSGTEETQD